MRVGYTFLGNMKRRVTRFWIVYKKNKAALAGLVILLVVLTALTLAPILSPYRPRRIVAQPLVAPSILYPMGTDNLGRDGFSSTLYGARISLMVGLIAALTCTILGIVIGAISGFYGGFIDNLLMRITEIFQVIPQFFLAIAAVAMIGQSIWNVIFIIGLTSWPAMARLVRGEFMSLRERPFVEAARGLGAGNATLVFGEILPNAMTPIIVRSSYEVARAILLEAGLSFLGLGDANVPSLGLMLFESVPYIQAAWWMSIFPGLFIALIVLSINLIGDGLNEALNPKFRER